MGVYVSVRGWLECNDEQLVRVREIIAAHDDNFYNGGWAFPTKPFSWTSYVFYGGDLRDHEAHWLLDELQEIAGIPPSDEDGGDVRGFFLASHEIEGSTEWRLREGKLLVFPAGERFRYLDE